MLATAVPVNQRPPAEVDGRISMTDAWTRHVVGAFTPPPAVTVLVEAVLGGKDATDTGLLALSTCGTAYSIVHDACAREAWAADLHAPELGPPVLNTSANQRDTPWVGQSRVAHPRIHFVPDRPRRADMSSHRTPSREGPGRHCFGCGRQTKSTRISLTWDYRSTPWPIAGIRPLTAAVHHPTHKMGRLCRACGSRMYFTAVEPRHATRRPRAAGKAGWIGEFEAARSMPNPSSAHREALSRGSTGAGHRLTTRQASLTQSYLDTQRRSHLENAVS